MMYEDLCTMKDTLMTWCKTEIAKGPESIDAKELGETIDMIKDLAEACYYESVTDAMSEGEPERYGYNHAHTSSGRFATRGNGRMSGYNHNIKEQPYIDAYLHDPNFYQEMDDMYNPRMGYHPNDYSMPDRRYGQAYNEYRTAKKHYTMTNAPEDKNHMDMKANEHLSDMINSMREIWKDADPMLRKRMTADMTALLNEMK